MEEAEWGQVSHSLTAPRRAAAKLADFAARQGQTLLIGDDEGRPAQVLFGLGAGARLAHFRELGGRLAAGEYRFEGPLGVDPTAAAVAFASGAYRFDRYRKATPQAHLAPPEGADPGLIRAQVHALALARDMINTPANDMGPLQIETIAREIAEAHGAAFQVTTGEALLEAGYPAVHAVGRAAAAHRSPRMIEFAWGDTGPRLAIVGKGVAFDTGGLDIKPTAGMRLMKKDMGGAAHALALARMVMAAGLPVRLSVLVPAVENAISADAMRPGDVIASRKGLTIEVGNTDAEGRLILADALTRAAELEPDLTLDFATLTGAARVALGPDLPPFYTDDEALAGAITAAALAAQDPLWRMPLWPGYEAALASDIADITNEPDAWAQAGSVTAALFLKRFAPSGAWAHLDIFGWNPRGRPGWPKGAEAQGLLALFAMLKARYV
jgi:leucyl aminopeptidase